MKLIRGGVIVKVPKKCYKCCFCNFRIKWCGENGVPLERAIMFCKKDR